MDRNIRESQEFAAALFEELLKVYALRSVNNVLIELDISRRTLGSNTNASRNVEEDDGHSRYSFVSEEIDMDDNDFGDFGSDPYEFANVIGDGDQPVYPGCRKYTKIIDTSRRFASRRNTIPTSMYEAKKTLCALGLSYEKMHACPNDCILYRKEYEDSTNCPTCGISRWKEGKDSILKEGVPAKVVWYFPPIPRFKRMFQSHETAKSLTWHAARKSIDGQMSHPADSPSWKLLDDKWPEFGNEPRNLRLALSSDGFNPHSSLSSRYSCWPVILVTYNLPPWLCMKRKFMMLTLLISGPKQPGNDIDVYLEPLIDDLKSLWVGIRGVYDAHNGEYFTLRAALMWTINDFPAYGNLSGCVVKGYKACPICGDDTPSHRLKNGHKICYIGHRKWLPINHPYRRQRAAFNGKPEYGIPPEPLTGEEVLHMVENGDRVCWKKKSIFFDLEYWKYLPVRHALDVMHIEKNVCDSIIGTLLEIPGKNKDGIAARLDLLNMGVKTDLQPEYGERRTRLPPGPWNLSRAEKREVPEGYSSNIKNLVSLQDSRLLGLKSHDCHTLMQQLLPVAIRSVLEKPARYAITRLCFFFNAICAKTVDVSKLDKLEEDVVVTLCLLEKYFPPSFFDIMVHLVVHLVREVRLCGPVYFRWMYPFERYMKVLKGYVQNRTRPEGCIAERYIAEEAVEFCTQHLSDVSTVGVPSSQKMGVSKPLSGCTVSVVDQDLLNQAHLYVLENTVTLRTGSAVARYCPLWAWLHSHQPARFCFWELTKQLPRVVTDPGIAPASHSLNFGVLTTPKPAHHPLSVWSMWDLTIHPLKGSDVLVGTLAPHGRVALIPNCHTPDRLRRVPYKAHHPLSVWSMWDLTNTEEVLPYIEQHMIHIKTAYPKFRKRTKWLQDKHNSTFIQWLRFKVQSELEEDNHGVSENLRWLAAGPNMAVPLYRSYLIKGIKFNIKAQDDVRTTQNSGVYLLAHTMQVASAKDKNPILSNMGFYGVIQEIWDLDYQKFTIPVFRCDWIDSSGLVVDELGFTLVDLSKIGHRNDQFVLASQVKQIFFVDDPMHRGWSVVLSMPNREYNDVIGDEVLGDVIIECEPFTRGMPNVDTFDELGGELGGQNIRGGCEDIWIE
ncbi:cyclic nucleotide gated channel 1 [Prunus dulcis]|uniref:Cyclic nucleotide gated channel 1 n=3 Tax=Prunus dulcis TaxID=3755 RepID=A0A4Y1QQN6_PRUDU|nr:cyclic nucleotide gated channel 1 [Prunus dulcis]